MTNRTGTRIVLTNIYGRQERYLLLAVDGDAAIARDGDGYFQGLKLDGQGQWQCVKVAQRDEAMAWQFARM